MNPPIPLGNGGNQQTQTESVNISAVVLKLPEFWTKIPIAWFHRVEAQFATRGITTEQTRYDYVVGSLPEEVVANVLEILENPGDTPYTTLKTVLIERHSKSESASLEQILSGTEIGDRTPSEFFRELKIQAGSSKIVNEELLKSLWMRRLPPLVHAAVKASVNVELADLLKMADSVHEVYVQQGLNLGSTSLAPNSAIHELAQQNQKLLNEVASLKKSFSDFKSNRGRDRSRSNSRGRFSSGKRADTNNSDMCWYHNRYGTNAKKCKSPCNFQSQQSKN